MTFTIKKRPLWRKKMSEIAVGYIRVSTEDQQRHSPKSQYNHIKNYIEEEGWKWRKKRLREVDIKLDSSISGAIPSDNVDSQSFKAEGFFVESGSGWEPEKRPVFYKMIDYVKKNKINHIISCYVDRIARNLYDYTYLCRKLEGSDSVHLHIVNENLAFSLSLKEDYEDRLKLENRLVTGKAESGRISQRVIKAREGRFEEGRVTYRVPYGYINKVHPTTRRPFIEIVPENAEKVKKIFEMMASGHYSLTSLTKKLEELGWKKSTFDRKLRQYIDKPITRSYLYYLLTNNTYLGNVKWRGRFKESAEVPQIIEKSTFEKVNKILKSKCNFRDGERKKGKYNSPFARLCKCHFCGCQITTDFTKNRHGKKYAYLRCTSGKRHRDLNWYKRKFGKTTCVQPYNTESGIEKAFNEEIQKVFMDEGIIAWLEGELKAEKARSQNLGGKAKKNLENQINQLEKRLKQLNIMRADGEFTKNEYLDARTETLNKIESLEHQIKKIDLSSTNVEDEIEITLDLMQKIPEKWADFSIPEKAEVLQLITKKITLGKYGKDKPEIVWEKPWDILIKYGELMGIGGNKIYPIEKNWHARRDLNPRPLDSKSTALSTELRAHLFIFNKKTKRTNSLSKTLTQESFSIL